MGLCQTIFEGKYSYRQMSLANFTSLDVDEFKELKMPLYIFEFIVTNFMILKLNNVFRRHVNEIPVDEKEIKFKEQLWVCKALCAWFNGEYDQDQNKRDERKRDEGQNKKIETSKTKENARIEINKFLVRYELEELK
jgi:hypothetical protein